MKTASGNSEKNGTSDKRTACLLREQTGCPEFAWRGLLTQAEGVDQLAVGGDVGALQVVEKLTTTAHHLQKTTAGVVILLVLLEVTREAVDAGREQSHLDFGRTRVAGGTLELRNNFSLVNLSRHCFTLVKS